MEYLTDFEKGEIRHPIFHFGSFFLFIWKNGGEALNGSGFGGFRSILDFWCRFVVSDLW